MPSNAVSGVGTLFRRWTGSAYQNIAEISQIDGPKKSRDTFETTSLDSTGGYKEFKASFRDAGTVTLNMNFTRATYEIMNNDFESDVLQNYEIVLPDAEDSTVEFQGLVTEIGLAIPMDDKISSDVTIKISGPSTLNSGASSGL
jgi:predicted secreted protein